MNTYCKYAANVFIAKCTQSYNKGDIAVLTTKHGKENEVVIHNLIKQKEGCFYYSFTRADGYNVQERAKAKAERYEAAAENAQAKSTEACEAAREGEEFLSLGEPIKIGHHSEKRHRASIERNNRRMDKAVELYKQAEAYADKAEAYRAHEDDINLSMPESLEYYTERLEAAQEYHAGLKSGKYPKEHNNSMAYANKAVKELVKKVETAKKLWA